MLNPDCREESLSQQERVGFSMNRSQEVHMHHEADIEQGKPNDQVRGYVWKLLGPK